MELTIKGLLKINLLKEAKIIAGNSGTEKIVSGITIMEAPDIADWVKGGELILTSLYTLNKLSDDEKKEIIDNLYKKNISAICFKKRNSEDETPQILIELGNKYKIPIILLPKEIPFIDIMNPIMGEIFNSQMIKLKYYKNVHERFTQLSLQNSDIDSVILTLSKIIKNPVAIYDKKLSCITTTDERIIDFSIIEESYGIYKDSSKHINYSRQRVKYNNLDNEELTQVLVPIDTVNNTRVYLVVCEKNERLKELDYIAIESAATVICLELVRQFSVAQVEKKFKNDLIDDMLSGSIKNKKELQERASLIGLNLNHKYIVCTIRLNDNSDIFDLKQEIIGDYIPNSFTRSRSSEVIMLIDINEYLKECNILVKKIKNIFYDLQRKIKSIDKNENITVGISNIINSMGSISKAYEESKEALELGYLMNGNGCIMSFTELGIFRILCNFKDRGELEKYIPEELKLLIEYDKNNNLELTKTFEIFLNNNRNASKTSKDMYIHHKTVIYRIEKIKSVTELDFTDYEKMLEIEVGFKIINMMNRVDKYK